jgi:hypothetical protein
MIHNPGVFAFVEKDEENTIIKTKGQLEFLSHFHVQYHSSSFILSHIEHLPVNHSLGSSASHCVGSESNVQYRVPTGFCDDNDSFCHEHWLGPLSYASESQTSSASWAGSPTHASRNENDQVNPSHARAGIRATSGDLHRHFSHTPSVMDKKTFHFTWFPHAEQGACSRKLGRLGKRDRRGKCLRRYQGCIILPSVSISFKFVSKWLGYTKYSFN